jgi:hypothetical protein
MWVTRNRNAPESYERTITFQFQNNVVNSIIKAEAVHSVSSRHISSDLKGNVFDHAAFQQVRSSLSNFRGQRDTCMS